MCVCGEGLLSNSTEAPGERRRWHFPALSPYQAGSYGSLFAWLNGIWTAVCTPAGWATQGKEGQSSLDMLKTTNDPELWN